MSLQLAAQHLASRGRGPDTQLIHMAPQEVAGLQALAKAHGGSLTINPDTGLPEAGFLSSVLPMVIGAGLSIASGGTLTPLMAAGITGAGYGVATGSLQKGLMAGLGAYGGAGLAGGLTAAGAAAGTGLTATGGVMGANPMLVEPMTLGTETLASSVPSATSSAVNVANSIPSTYATNPEAFATNAYNASPIRADMAVTNAVPTLTPPPSPISDRFSQAFQGVKNLGTSEGRDLFMGNAASKGVEAQGVGGMKGLMQYGLAGLAPVAMDMMTPKQQELAKQEERKRYEYNFAYNPTGAASTYAPSGYDSSERLHFNPVYTRTAAGGGLMDIGPVEAMSRANQSQMAPAYARGGSSDVNVDTYTGAETFAEGGATKAVKPVEQDPYYTMSGMSGDVYKYLMGQGTAPTAPAPVAAAPAPAPAPVQSTVQPAAVATPRNPLRGMFGKMYEQMPSSGQQVLSDTMAGNRGMQLLLGQTPSPEAEAAGGYWKEDTSGNVKPYTFDPVTGTFTAAPAPKVWVPYEPEPVSTNPFGRAMSSADRANMDGIGGMAGNANGGLLSLAQGGQSHLGDYSDGGRLLRGPGDGVSDSIPASIGDKRPARLADGEFVVPARIVSELGNGSTEAGARKLYAMMDRVQKARGKTVGKDRVAVNSKAERMLPA